MRGCKSLTLRGLGWHAACHCNSRAREINARFAPPTLPSKPLISEGRENKCTFPESRISSKFYF